MKTSFVINRMLWRGYCLCVYVYRISESEFGFIWHVGLNNGWICLKIILYIQWIFEPELCNCLFCLFSLGFPAGSSSMEPRPGINSSDMVDSIHLCYENVNKSCVRAYVLPPAAKGVLNIIFSCMVLLIVTGNMLVIVSILHFKQVYLHHFWTIEDYYICLFEQFQKGNCWIFTINLVY